MGISGLAAYDTLISELCHAQGMLDNSKAGTLNDVLIGITLL